MHDQARPPSAHRQEHTPSDLLRALTTPGVDLPLSEERLRTLRELYEVVREAHTRRREPRRQPAADPPDPSSRKQTEPRGARRRRLSERFDASFPPASPGIETRPYAHTPGELCERLFALTLALDDLVPDQNDTSRPGASRRRSLDRVPQLQALRSHLQRCLAQALEDASAGRALFPPHPDFRRIENPYVNPVVRKEVAVDIYAFARKAPPPAGEIRHILGLACNGHGASLSYLGRDGTVRSSVFDRWAGTKYTLLMSKSETDEVRGRDSPIAAEMHDLLVYSYGAFPEHRVFEEVFPAWLGWLLTGLEIGPEDIDLLVSSESNFITNAFRLGPHLHRWVPRAQVVTDVEHHAVHQRQAFWASGFAEAAVLTLDTCGENLARLNHHKVCGTIAAMDRDRRCEILREHIFPYASAGLIYSIVNHHLGFSQGQEGKTMGLAPYGRPDLYRRLSPHLRLYPDGSFDFLSYRELQKALENYEPERAKTRGAPFSQKHCDVAYAGQALLEDTLVNAFRAALRLTGSRNLVFAGGIALNSVANEIAIRAAAPDRVYIPPNPSDTGQALGCALYGAHELAGWPPRAAEIPEYLGPQYGPGEILEAVRACAHHRTRLAEPEGVIARCITNGHIVARFSGSSEFGPRALGNRSILADPRRSDMKDHLNRRVKHREAFRPFAPSVLLEHVSAWFELNDRSPYMLRVVRVPEPVRRLVPAIVHVDGSARVQTVDRLENPGYWGVIEAFRRLTGVPLVLNTSFNVAGKPIVERPRDAVACFETTDIDVLLIGDWVLSKCPLDEFEKRLR